METGLVSGGVGGRVRLTDRTASVDYPILNRMTSELLNYSCTLGSRHGTS